MNQTQILKFLIQNEKVYELAKKISEEGYFVGEEPIICFENSKKIVLEGNRRTAALKLLQDPKKYLKTARANILLKNILSNNIQVDFKIRCFIAPNRLLANPIIYERHNGATLQRWKTGNQYSFVAEMYYEDGLTIEEICDVLNEGRANVLKPLKAYNLFHEGKLLLEKEDGTEADIAEFNFTNLERFYLFEDAREFLGIEFHIDDGELIINIPKEEFEKRFLFVFKNLLDAERFSRDFNKEPDKNNYISRLRANPAFDFSIQLINKTVKSKASQQRANLDAAKSNITVRKRKSNKSSYYFNSIIARDLNIIFEHDKLDELFAELKSLSNDKKYSFALLLRSYLEQSIYHYLSKKNLLEIVNKKANEDREKNGLIKVNAVIKYLKNKYGIEQNIEPSHIMGILKFNTSSEFSQGLRQMLDYIKNNELENHLDQSQLKNLKHYIDRIKDGLDLAVHNLDTYVDFEHNKRAWNHLLPLFQILSNNINRD